jgi:glucan phosphoethanolaminetransferase (alkaline phosphatase superfamily)
MKRISQKVLQAAMCLFCAVAAWNSLEDLTGTELVGGTVTGPMINVAAIAAIVLVLAVVVTFIWRRVAAISALVASALCLPLYIYRTLPRLFRSIFPGLYKGPSEGTLIWHSWSITGILATVVVAYLCYRSLLSQSDPPVSTVRE